MIGNKKHKLDFKGRASKHVGERKIGDMGDGRNRVEGEGEKGEEEGG